MCRDLRLAVRRSFVCIVCWCLNVCAHRESCFPPTCQRVCALAPAFRVGGFRAQLRAQRTAYSANSHVRIRTNVRMHTHVNANRTVRRTISSCCWASSHAWHARSFHMCAVSITMPMGEYVRVAAPTSTTVLPNSSDFTTVH